MSCNGCRVLRKGCSETCVLRSSLRWIEYPEAQGNATLFLAKFFGRSDLLSLISSVPEPQRPVLFQSLLFEACGRTVSPVNGAVGLLSSGNWHICQAAVETVLQGGVLRPIPGTIAGDYWMPISDEPSDHRFYRDISCNFQSRFAESKALMMMENESGSTAASDLSLSLTTKLGGGRRGSGRGYEEETKKRAKTMSSYSEESEITTFASNGNEGGSQERKILNLFV